MPEATIIPKDDFYTILAWHGCNERRGHDRRAVDSGTYFSSRPKADLILLLIPNAFP